MSSYTYPTYGPKVLIFLIIILINTTCNNSELQPPLINQNQSFSENPQKTIHHLKPLLLDTPASAQIGLNTFENSAPNSGIIEGQGGVINSNNGPQANSLNKTIDKSEGYKPQPTSSSKPRKDADPHNAVARKGAPTSGGLYNSAPIVPLINSSVNEQPQSVRISLPINNIENNASDGQAKMDLIERKKSEKPKYTYDDDSDNDNHSTLFKTSANGEDYIIIGIVIVIGIWFSVFGALIFYRRAGEYWDRRHYRRMDFLVEGMYND